MKTMEPILPPPTTELEAWQRWTNRLQTQLLQLHISNKRKIEVKSVSV